VRVGRIVGVYRSASVGRQAESAGVWVGERRLLRRLGERKPGGWFDECRLHVGPVRVGCNVGVCRSASVSCEGASVTVSCQGATAIASREGASVSLGPEDGPSGVDQRADPKGRSAAVVGDPGPRKGGSVAAGR
jgi:hypothetical protein